MITIYRRGRVWWARGSANGTILKRRSLDTRNRDVAAKRAAELELNLGHGLETAITWERFTREFIAWIDSDNLAEGTKVKYRFTLGRFGGFLEQQRIGSLSGITASTIPAYIMARRRDVHPHRKTPIGPEGLKADLRALRKILRFAAEREYVNSRVVKFPRLNSKPRGTLPFSQDEVERMLAKVDHNPYTKAVLLAFLYTGLRISDIIGMRKDAVSFDSGQMRIAVKKKRGAILHLPAHPELLSALREHLNAAEGPRRSSPFMFPTESGTPNRKLDGILRRLWKRCGIEGAHAHRFRDTFAVGLLARGASTYDVAKLMGITEAVAARHYEPYVKELQERGKALVGSLNFLSPGTTGAHHPQDRLHVI